GSGTVTNVGSHEGIAVGDEWTGSGWKQYDLSGKLVTGEWVKIEQSITWEDAMSIGSGGAIDNISLRNVALRIANLNGTNAVVDGAPLDYEIDDFIIRYPAPAAAEKLSYRQDFNSETATGALDGRSEDCSPTYKKIVYESKDVDASKGYIINKQANYSLNGVKAEPGNLYKISGWFRYDADDTATDFVANKAKLRLIFMGKDRNDPAFEKGSNYPSFYSEIFPEGAWTYLEYYFYMDYRMYTKNPDGYLYTRICPIASYQGGAETSHTDHTIPGTYSFDNIKVEELGRTYSGDMELDNSIPVIRNFKEVTQVVPGFNASGATLEKKTEGGNTYLSVTTTGATHGSAQTPYAFENGKKYRISFRAKLGNAEDGVVQPLTMILDRKVTETGTGDAYTVPNYEYVIGGNKLGNNVPAEGHPWQISNRWQTFSTIYTTNFSVKEGMEETAPNVNPRCANTYLYTYDAENKVNPKGTVLCLDDFKVEEIPVPTVDKISFQKENDAIRVSYDYIPKASEAENKDATLIRAFLKNGETETNIGTFSGNETFLVPPIAVGKTIWFEIIPVDADGNIGNGAEKACDIVFEEAQNCSLTVSEDKKSITWRADVSASEFADTNYRVGAAVYADNFSMLFTDVETYALTEGVNRFENTFSVPEGAKSVKLFVWDAKANAPLMKALELDLTK
ncbi:MAG: hypothetical protein IJC78_02595, partial [Clostridia bacterium]|nr:hypothetical protein [Clostridia bacterium]